MADVEHLRFLLLLFRYDGVGVLSSGRYNASSGQAEFWISQKVQWLVHNQPWKVVHPYELLNSDFMQNLLRYIWTAEPPKMDIKCFPKLFPPRGLANKLWYAVKPIKLHFITTRACMNRLACQNSLMSSALLITLCINQQMPTIIFSHTSPAVRWPRANYVTVIFFTMFLNSWQQERNIFVHLSLQHSIQKWLLYGL